MYATGQPITVPASTYFVSSIPDNSNANNGWGYYQYRIYPGTIDSYRLPPYARLDLSITYEKNYSGWTLAPFIQVFNIGNRKNTWFIQYETEGTGYQVNQKIEKYNMLPILPSIGVNIKF
jgi:hypothetical protein